MKSFDNKYLMEQTLRNKKFDIIGNDVFSKGEYAGSWSFANANKTGPNDPVKLEMTRKYEFD